MRLGLRRHRLLSACAQALDGGGERLRHLLPADPLGVLERRGGWRRSVPRPADRRARVGLLTGNLRVASAFEVSDSPLLAGALVFEPLGASDRGAVLAFQFSHTYPRREAIPLDLDPQRCDGALERDDLGVHARTALSHDLQPHRKRGALLLGPFALQFGARTALLGLLAQEIGVRAAAYGVVAASLGIVTTTLGLLEALLGVLLHLGAELLLGVLALLGAAQLALAFGELLSRVLALAFGLGLAAAQLGQLALERVDGRLGDLGAPGLSGLSDAHRRAGAAGATLGQHIVADLVRATLA